jgi:hypothetical protein
MGASIDKMKVFLDIVLADLLSCVCTITDMHKSLVIRVFHFHEIAPESVCGNLVAVVNHLSLICRHSPSLLGLLRDRHPPHEQYLVTTHRRVRENADPTEKQLRTL